MTISCRLVAVAAFIAVAGVPARAQQPQLTVQPSRPKPGAIVRLVLSGVSGGGDSVSAVTGTIGGEPLHFARAPAGRYTALGGISVDSVSSTTVEAIVSRTSGRADTLRVTVQPPPLPPAS